MNLKLFSQGMKNKIVDSHCHLDFDDFSKDLNDIILNAKTENVEYMLSISVNLEKFKEIFKIVKKYDNIWCTTGVHPNNVPQKIDIKEIDKLKNNLEQNLSKNKVVGLGETGLDYFRNLQNKKNQMVFFESHMEVSGKTKLPTVVHTRDADQDTIFFIKNFVKKYNTTGLIHCFSSGKSLATCALDNGFYISFSGIITFGKSDELREIVNYVPLDRILVETDSPYLAPVPKRGKRNEPAFTKFTLEKIAEIKNLNTDKVAEVTTNNFFNLFSKAKNNEA